MFNCQICGEKGVGPKVKLHKLVSGIRHVSYHNEYVVEDEWGNREKREVDSVGTEATGEVFACAACAQADEPRKPSVERRGHISFREKEADPMRVKFIANVVHSALDRLNHASKRAQQDCMVVVPAVKAFTDHNKDFTF